MTAAEVQAQLAAAPGVVVVLPSARLPDGARVDVTIAEVTASGVIPIRSLHWSTMKGVNTVPVVLDGTGQLIAVPASLVTPSSERSNP